MGEVRDKVRDGDGTVIFAFVFHCFCLLFAELSSFFWHAFYFIKNLSCDNHPWLSNRLPLLGRRRKSWLGKLGYVSRGLFTSCSGAVGRFVGLSRGRSGALGDSLGDVGVPGKLQSVPRPPTSRHGLTFGAERREGQAGAGIHTLWTVGSGASTHHHRFGSAQGKLGDIHSLSRGPEKTHFPGIGAKGATGIGGREHVARG